MAARGVDNKRLVIVGYQRSVHHCEKTRSPRVRGHQSPWHGHHLASHSDSTRCRRDTRNA